MQRKNLYVIIIIVGLLLLIFNLILSKEYDLAFYLRITSNLLIILTAILGIVDLKKNRKAEDLNK